MLEVRKIFAGETSLPSQSGYSNLVNIFDTDSKFCAPEATRTGLQDKTRKINTRSKVIVTIISLQHRCGWIPTSMRHFALGTATGDDAPSGEP